MEKNNKKVNSGIILVIVLLLVLGAIAILLVVSETSSLQNGENIIDMNLTENDNLQNFKSDQEFIKFLNSSNSASYPTYRAGIGGVETLKNISVSQSASATSDSISSNVDYSQTNVQVEGVDEADIVKTDGEYIYVVSNNKIYIVKAYPTKDAKVVSMLDIPNFTPQEIFIDNDRLLVFGNISFEYKYPEDTDDIGKPVDQQEESFKIMPSYYHPTYRNFMSVRLYDTQDKSNPKLLRKLFFEGDYVTSRKVENYAYFVINSYPQYWAYPLKADTSCGDIVPLFGDLKQDTELTQNDLVPITKCTDIGYIPSSPFSNFITVASISLSDSNKDIHKKVILGNGQNVYASLNNLYIAQSVWPRWQQGQPPEETVANTVVTKFSFDDGEINYLNIGKVKGTVLNQFSMDEYQENFRIATTVEGYDNVTQKSFSNNNLYILNKDMQTIGKLENIAPGEKIYSVRFMGKRGYVVTFKRMDPLFVIDLSNPVDPHILGKLKIPGWSDYLHPYDETHLIGIGKDVNEDILAKDSASLPSSEEGFLPPSAIMGVKLSLFDVSDVEHPIEMYKVVIGDRGTESLAAQEHKAFLFDKEKNLLVIPITLAEIQSNQPEGSYGDYTFQGVYVYNLDLKNGFKLKGRITHHSPDDFLKMGYYYATNEYDIKRSLFINNVLYTISENGIKLNDLSSSSLLEITDISFNVKLCAKEGENYSAVYTNKYPSSCCDGLTEWESGMDTRISIEDNCYNTGLLSGSPIGTCIKCGDGICGENENPCNCSVDCIGKNKSDYLTIEDFCESDFWINLSDNYNNCENNSSMVNTELCKLCK